MDSIRIDELVGSFQTYEMMLLDSQKLGELAFKASKNKGKWPKKKSENIRRNKTTNPNVKTN